jgi:hypothetical protein
MGNNVWHKVCFACLTSFQPDAEDVFVGVLRHVLTSFVNLAQSQMHVCFSVFFTAVISAKAL